MGEQGLPGRPLGLGPALLAQQLVQAPGGALDGDDVRMVLGEGGQLVEDAQRRGEVGGVGPADLLVAVRPAQMTPRAIIASATRMKPAMLAPVT